MYERFWGRFLIPVMTIFRILKRQHPLKNRNFEKYVKLHGSCDFHRTEVVNWSVKLHGSRQFSVNGRVVSAPEGHMHARFDAFFDKRPNRRHVVAPNGPGRADHAPRLGSLCSCHLSLGLCAVRAGRPCPAGMIHLGYRHCAPFDRGA